MKPASAFLFFTIINEFASATMEVASPLIGDDHGDLVRIAGKRTYSADQWRKESALTELSGAHKKFKKTKSYRRTQENTVRMLIKLCEEVADEDQETTENEVLKTDAVDKTRPFPQFSTAPLYLFKYKRFGSLLDQQERSRKLRNKMRLKVGFFFFCDFENKLFLFSQKEILR